MIGNPRTFRSGWMSTFAAKQTHITAPLGPQLLVSTPLYNQTLLEYNNFIAIPNRTESVGNHNTRTTAPSQIPVYNQLCLSIQGTGCFIQHQHRWISHQGAGNFQSLALSPTQIHSPFNQLRLVSSGQ